MRAVKIVDVRTSPGMTPTARMIIAKANGYNFISPRSLRDSNLADVGPVGRMPIAQRRLRPDQYRTEAARHVAAVFDPRVADRDKNVSDEAVAANSLDRRAGEGGPERTIIQRNKVTQMGGREVRSRYDLRMRGGMSKPVPGTNGEAVIATIYSVAHQRSELVRYRAGMLDCQV